MHAFALIGLTLVVVGCGMIYVPAGLIAAGVALVVLDRFGVDL